MISRLTILRHIRCGLLTVIACSYTLAAAAQTPQPDAIDPNANSVVYSLAVQPDGKILIGGEFTTIGGVTRSRIARLNADGTLDTAFNPNAGFTVNALAVQADGKILASGGFSGMGGVTRNRIARLNADGTLDGAFNPNAGSTVNALAVQADNKILVGGQFTTMGGVSRNRIARLNADGTLDSVFNPNANSLVYALALQSDNKILIGGNFMTLGGVTRNRIARLNEDGTLDAAFNPDASSTVNALTVQIDGKILVCGGFTMMGGVTRNRIARLNADGTLDAAFDPNANNTVYSLALQADGKILISGSFTTIGGVTRNRIARLNVDGTLDEAFNPDAGSVVNALVVQSDGKILSCGQFTTMGGVTRNRIARLNSSGVVEDTVGYDGETVTWLRGGIAPEVWRTTFEHLASGSSWTMLGAGSRIPGGWQLAGVFATGGVIRARGYATVGFYNGSGVIVESVWGAPVITAHHTNVICKAGMNVMFGVAVIGSSPIRCRWRKDGVDLADGGQVSGATTMSLKMNNVLKGDEGAYDVVLVNSCGSVTSGVATLTVTDPAIQIQPVSQALEVGGNATLSVTVAGTDLTCQWWKEGLLLTGSTNTVLSMTNLQGSASGNYFLVAHGAYGSVTSAVVELSVNLASVETAFNPSTSSYVYSLGVQPDSKILIGGSFTTVGGVTRNRIARLNADGMLDSSFNPNASSTVAALAVQADGKILLGGQFTTVGGVTRNYIARLNVDGTLDAAFNPNANNWVYALALQADGKILLGGNFTTMGGVTRNRIARLNEDGTLDAAFNPDASSTVSALALQADGKILVGGGFTTMGGVTRNYIARLNADGTLDAAFNPNAGSTVDALAVQADNKILVGGHFTTLGGMTSSRIVRLNADGTLDTAFNPNANGYVLSLAVQSDGKIAIGGEFTAMGGLARNRIARLNADGTLDAAFNPNASSYVYSLAVQADGKVLVGGIFSTMGGVTRNYIARLNSTGEVTGTLGVDGEAVTWLRGGPASEVWRTTFECSTNGRSWTMLGEGVRIPGGWQWEGVSVTGSVIRARGYTTGGIYNGSGGIMESIWGAPIITEHPTNLICRAGMTAMFGVAVVGSAPVSYRWRKDGVDLADGGKVSGATSPSLNVSDVLKGDEGAYDVVSVNTYCSVTSGVALLTVVDPSISVQPISQVRTEGSNVTFSVTAVGTGELKYQWRKNGEWLAGATNFWLTFNSALVTDTGNYDVVATGTYGSITSAVAVLTINLGKMDWFFSPNASSYVYALAVQADAKILVGGDFTTMDGVTRNRIARLNADDTLDATFNPDASGGVYALAVQADNKILVGGGFTTIGGVSRNRIARLNANGTLDTVFNPNVGSPVYSLAVQADGKILVGGDFTTIGGVTRKCIARLNADGTLDTAFNPNAGSTVYALAVQADGKILVGGNFMTMGGVTRNYIARLNADGTLDTAFNPNANNSVYSLAVQADGKILVGGYFMTMGGVTRNRIARLNADGTLDAAFNPNANASVYALALQANGKILSGGWFTTMGGVTRNYIARLNADGALDADFNPNANNAVNALAIQIDGKTLAGGQFTKMDGLARNRIARLNSTEPIVDTLGVDGEAVTWLRGGTAPEVWRTTFEFFTNGISLPMRGDGVRIPGGWQLAGVSTAGAVIRVRGYTTGGQYNGSGGIVERVWGGPIIIAHPTNLICRAGMTAMFGVEGVCSAPVRYRWRKDGVDLADGGKVVGATEAWISVSDVLKGDEGAYDVVIVNPDGCVTSRMATLTVVDPVINVQPVSQAGHAGGNASFSVTATGTGLTYQWWKDGLLLSGATNTMLSMTNLQGADEGNYSIVVYGSYGCVTSAVVELSVNLASVDAAFNPNAGGSGVSSLAVQPDGKILLGGWFSSIGGVLRNSVARVNADGTLDETFNPPSPDASVTALAIQPDGKILVGGHFMEMGGVTRNRIARLNADGTLDTAFNPNANYPVFTLMIQADGKILVGGNFSVIGGVSRTCFARLHANGINDTTFAPGPNGEVYSLALQADGKIVVGGFFTTMGGVARNRIARLSANGTLDAAFNPNVSIYIYSLAIQPDTKILISGSFTTVGGVTRNNIARLNADGTLDTLFNPEVNDSVVALALQADGKILVGGGFTTVNGVTRNNVARLNADGTLDTDFKPNANNGVSSLAVQADGKILVGGGFTTIGGEARNRIARLNSFGPVVDTVAYDGETFTWLRGGNAPEVSRTTFEYSDNGTDWAMLGAGVRMTGGWRLAGLSVKGGVIRARGYATSGLLNGSGVIVESEWGGPIITEHPTNFTCRAGMSATFGVTAIGSKPMSYQWSKDGINVDCATNATLILTDATCAQAGDYRVTISNSCGTVTSANAVLIMVPPLTIVTSVLPPATVGYPYSAVLQATGGIPHYCWAPVSGKYSETVNPNSFSSGGVAQGWKADDTTWNLQLPFTFRFYGKAYTQCWVDSNGRIIFASSGEDHTPTVGELAATPMIAVLWGDLTTVSGDVYVSVSAEEVAIRWNGTYYNNSLAVNVSASLGRNGNVTIKYGNGNVNGGMIGISSGDGTNYSVSAKSQSGSMAIVPDIVFSPSGNLPSGLQLSTNGVLTGTPTTAGVYWPSFVVADSGGFDTVTNIMMQVANAPFLNIVSDHGITQPSTVATNYSAVVSESLTNSPVVNGTTQYVCKGWSLAGVLATHGQASGDTTTVAMTLTNNATLTWLWTTNCWFQREAGADGSVSGDTNGWYAIGSQVTVTVAPNSGYRLAYWTGDVPAGHTHDNPLVLAMDAARSVTAHFTVITLNGFDVWMQSKGLSGDPAIAFISDRNSDNIANGFEYAFGTNWSFGQDMLNIRLVNREPVVEFPMQDSNTIPYVSLTLKGCTNLLCLPGDWTLQTAPATNTTGKPANRNWYVPVGVPPTNAFFRLNATLLQ